SGIKTFVAAQAMGRCLRVKAAGVPGQCDLAGWAEPHLGMTIDAAATGEGISVRLKNSPGMFHMVASGGGIGVVMLLFGAVGGKVSKNPMGAIATALETAGADVDIIEVMPHFREPV